MDLRALRLNCFLAPLVPTFLAVGLVLYGQHLGVEHLAAQDRAEARAQVAAWARQGRTDLAAADPRWRVVEVLEPVGDRLRPLGGGPEREPEPEMVQVVDGPQVWTTPTGGVAAAALLPGTSPARILFAVRPPAAPPVGGEGLALAILAAGGLLAWYLARRIYRPVEALVEEAQAALDQRPSRSVFPTSDETATLRSSITELAHRYRSSTRPPDA